MCEYDLTICYNLLFAEFSSAIVKLYASCSDNSIGGEGIVVKVDETKVGKRKYYRVEGMLFVI